MGGLRGGRLLLCHLTLQLRVLLLLLRLLLELLLLLRLLGLHLGCLLLLLLHLLLRRLRLKHGLRAHHLHERVLVVGHHAVGKLRLLLSHEGL